MVIGGIVFGLLYAFFASIGKVVLKKGLVSLPSSVSFFWETIFGLILWIPVSLHFGVDFSSIPEILWVVVLGAILSEAYIFYIYSKGDISVIGTIFPSYSLFTIFFSIILINESPSYLQLLAALIIFLGVISIAFSNYNKEISWLTNLSPALWALSGAIGIGFADSLGKGVINNTSSFTLLFTLALVQIPVALIFLKLERQSILKTSMALRNLKKYKLSLISAFMIAVAQLFFWMSFENTLASVASPITSTVSMFTVIFAYVFLKESLNFRKFIGAILVLTGVILMGIL